VFDVKLFPEAVEFMDSLDLKMHVKVLRGIDLLEKFGYELNEPHSKYLKQYDIHEL
jgi:hypothetical protein